MMGELFIFLVLVPLAFTVHGADLSLDDTDKQDTTIDKNGTTDFMEETFIGNLTFLTHEQKEGLNQYSKIYISLLFVSNFFVLVTILIYLVLQDLRTNLFGKLTLGFLINVFFSFLLTGIHYSLNLKDNSHLLGGTFCWILAYLIQHFFLAFFFWLSAMSINITHAFNTFSFHSADTYKTNADLLKNILFAQGIPLLISLLTFLVDRYGKEDMILPNMGKYSCFIGSISGSETHFLTSPKFLYFYLIISLVMIANLICFIITGGNLTKQWHQSRGLSTQQNNSGHVITLGKLFVIMGVPWVGDIVSASLAHTYLGRYSEASLVLDIINLLSGVLIFIVLICKQNVFSSLLAISKQFTSKEVHNYSTYNLGMIMDKCSPERPDWTPTKLAVTKFFFFRTCLPFIDVGTDISSFLYLYSKGHHSWAALTLMWMFVPFTVNFIIVTNNLIVAIIKGQSYSINQTLRLIKESSRKIILHFPCAIPLRNAYLAIILLKGSSINSQEIYEESALSSFYESFLESGPQVIQQVVIISSTGQISVPQALSVVSSLFFLTWAACTAFFVQRQKDYSDPDPKMKLVLNIFPWMYLVVLNNVLQLSILGGLLGKFVFISLLLTFAATMMTLKILEKSTNQIEIMKAKYQVAKNEFFKLKAALTSLWLPCVIGDKPYMFLATAAASQVTKTIALCIALTLAYSSLYPKEIHRSASLLYCSDEESIQNLNVSHEVCQGFFTNENPIYRPCFDDSLSAIGSFKDYDRNRTRRSIAGGVNYVGNISFQTNDLDLFQKLRLCDENEDLRRVSLILMLIVTSLLSVFGIYKLNYLSDNWNLYQASHHFCCFPIQPSASLSLVRSLTSQNRSEDLSTVIQAASWQEINELLSRTNHLGQNALQIALSNISVDCFIPILKANTYGHVPADEMFQMLASMTRPDLIQSILPYIAEEKTISIHNIFSVQPQGNHCWSDKDLCDSQGAITAVDLLNIDKDQTVAIRIRYGESWSKWRRTCISSVSIFSLNNETLLEENDKDIPLTSLHTTFTNQNLSNISLEIPRNEYIKSVSFECPSYLPSMAKFQPIHSMIFKTEENRSEKPCGLKFLSGTSLLEYEYRLNLHWREDFENFENIHFDQIETSENFCREFLFKIIDKIFKKQT